MGEDGPRGRAEIGRPLGADGARRRRVLYGRRRGRKLRAGRAARVAAALPRLDIALPEDGVALQPAGLFDRAREVWLEIGFGAGEHLAAQAELHPDVGFIGCEPFLDGVAKLVAAIEERGLANVRLFRDDARLLLAALPPASIARAFVLFPDPWPKARHHKRRILSRDGFAALARVTRPEAELRAATDDEGYRDWMIEHAAAEGSFALVSHATERPDDWPPTRYEGKARAAGRGCSFLSFKKEIVPI